MRQGRFILSLSFVLAACCCFSQNRKQDSIRKVLRTAAEDTVRVKALNGLSWELMYTNADSSIQLGKQALELAERLGWKKGMSEANGNLGVYYRLKADYTAALACYFSAMKMDEQLGNKKGIARNLGNIGLVYWNQGDNSRALDYYFKALKMDEELGNKARIPTWYINIGLAYWSRADHKLSLEFFFKALEMEQGSGHKATIATILGNIGNVYADMSLRTSGSEQQKYYDLAIDYYKKTLAMREELGAKNLIASALTNIGSLYVRTKRYSEAEPCLQRALELSKEIGGLSYQREVELIYCELDSARGNYKGAFEHYKGYISARDSISNDENTKKQTQMEMQYEFDKKESQARAEQDKKDTVSRIVIYSISAGLLLVLLLAIFIFRSYRQKQKANVEITAQKKVIEEKQKEVLDSIYYASRIQQALITSEAYIEKALKRLRK